MEVILKEDVPSLGHRGDVVKVADGYGRNYLLPRKLAMQATAANKAVIDQMKIAEYNSSVQQRTAEADLSYDLQKFKTQQLVRQEEIRQRPEEGRN